MIWYCLNLTTTVVLKVPMDYHSAGHAWTRCTPRRNVCRHSFGRRTGRTTILRNRFITSPWRGANEQKHCLKAIEGENLNILIGSRPIRADKGSNLFKLNIMKLIHEKYDIVEEDFVSAEIEFVPAFPARDVGFDKSMIGGYGHDDRVCAYPAIEAAIHCKAPKQTILTVLADKEEVGSDGNTGLNSSFLRYFVADLARQEGLDGYDVLRKPNVCQQMLQQLTTQLTAVLTNHLNSCYLNNGIGVMKYTGARGKAGTSDASAEFMAEIRKIFDSKNILWQTGELGKVDGGGGGTVAMYIAKFGCRCD